jgi:hypothetical protein
MVAYTNSASNALVLLHILALLHLSAGVIVDLLHAHILLTTAKLRGINGDEKTLHSASLCVLNIFFRDFAITVNIELHEELLVVRLSVDDIVEGARCKSCDLQAASVG